jgi:predicted nucleotidyltransferase
VVKAAPKNRTKNKTEDRIENKTENQTENWTLKAIKEKFEQVLMEKNQTCVFAFLMGSAGTERFHKESDIDIAVYLRNPDNQTVVDYGVIFKMQARLGELFQRDCDLVVLNKIDPIFARQVLESGRELIVNDSAFLNIWKAQQLSLYPDFKESRKIIEDNLLNRKKYV